MMLDFLRRMEDDQSSNPLKNSLACDDTCAETWKLYYLVGEAAILVMVEFLGQENV